MSFVICRLPRAGLGNQLFPLMKAYVFAHLNNLPVVVTNYQQIRIGPYLRGEKSKRQYSGYFNFQIGIFSDIINRMKITFSRSLISQEHKLEKLSIATTRTSYRFETIPNWINYFDQLRENRQLVKKLLIDLLKKEIIQDLEKLTPPVVGIHIRMGDFRKLAEGEDFSKVGAVRTPEGYFVKIIQSIRSIHGSELPVSIFTDGYAHEFKRLFSLNNITLVEGNRDIVDLLLLSRSKIIITSAGSTFSYWAGFLSEAPIIMHPDHIHQPIRLAYESNSYEGAFDVTNKKLIEQIKKIE